LNSSNLLSIHNRSFLIFVFIPLFIIMFKITQLRNCGISGCRKKTFEYRNVFLTTTIKDRSKHLLWFFLKFKI